MPKNTEPVDSAIATLVASGIDLATLTQQLQDAAIKNSRTNIPVMALPPDLPSWIAWIADGNGTNDPRGETRLMVDSFPDDPAGFQLHLCQLGKNILYGAYPDLGAELMVKFAALVASQIAPAPTPAPAPSAKA